MIKIKKLKVKNKIKKNIFNLVIALLIVTFIGAMYKVITIIYYDNKNQKDNKKLIEEVVKVVEDDKFDEEKETSKEEKYEIDFKTLKGRNKDVVGWIIIPNTNINYPVVRGQDNSYYLTKDLDKNYNRNGTIFMNYKNSRDFSDSNTVLFGHNTSNGTMFGDLKRIYNMELGNEVDIYIYMDNLTYRYRVYSAEIKEPYDATPLATGTRFFGETDKKFKYEKTDLETLTLSTCHTDRTKRLIIHALKQEVLEANNKEN